MEILSSQFSLKYEVTSFIIKVTASGEINGNKYGASVKLTSTNLYSFINEQTNTEDEKKEELIFKIKCASESEAQVISNHLRDMRKNGEVLSFDGMIPNQRNEVLVLTPNSYFIGVKSKKAS